jgi:hypothetical protein
MREGGVFDTLLMAMGIRSCIYGGPGGLRRRSRSLALLGANANSVLEGVGGGGMDVCLVRVLCCQVGLITRPEECRIWCVLSVATKPR